MDVSSSLIGQSDDGKPTGVSTGQILSNLFSVFNPLSSALKNKLSSSNHSESGESNPLFKSLNVLLNNTSVSVFY